MEDKSPWYNNLMNHLSWYSQCEQDFGFVLIFNTCIGSKNIYTFSDSDFSLSDYK